MARHVIFEAFAFFLNFSPIKLMYRTTVLVSFCIHWSRRSFRTDQGPKVNQSCKPWIENLLISKGGQPAAEQSEHLHGTLEPDTWWSQQKLLSSILFNGTFWLDTFQFPAWRFFNDMGQDNSAQILVQSRTFGFIFLMFLHWKNWLTL